MAFGLTALHHVMHLNPVCKNTSNICSVVQQNVYIAAVLVQPFQHFKAFTREVLHHIVAEIIRFLISHQKKSIFIFVLDCDLRLTV